MSSAIGDLAESRAACERRLVLQATWRTRLPGGEGALVLVFLLFLVLAESSASSGAELIALGVYLGIFGLLWFGYRYYTFTSAETAIVFEPDAVCLPHHVGARRSQRIPYADVWTVEAPGRYARGQVLIGTRRDVYRYPERAFVLDAPARVLSEWIASTLAELPDGAALRARFEQSSQLAAQQRKRPARATWAIVAALCVVFTLQSLLLRGEPWKLVRFGAEVPLLVARGQIYRICTGGLLHAGLLHIFCNVVALVWVGARFERVLDAASLTSVFLAAVVGGSFTGLAIGSNHLVSVGASGGVFGLIAGFAVLNYARDRELAAALRIPTGSWIALVVSNLAAPLLHPEIDWRAHLGGALTGALLTFAMLRRAVLADVRVRTPRWVGPTAQALVAMFALSSIAAALHAVARDDADERALGARLLGDSNPSLINTGAWTFAVSRSASADELAHARAAAQHALQMKEAPEFRDTLATLEYRLGDYPQAISDELLALRRANGAHDENYRAQLARFLRAQVDHAGARLPADLSVQLQLSAGATGTTLRLHTDPPLSPGQRFELYGYAVQGSRTLGLLSVLVGTDGASEIALGSSAHWPSGTRFEIGMARRL